MKQTIKKIWRTILSPYYHLRAIIAYDKAVRMAEENLAYTGQRTYVIKGAGRRLVLCDRKSFRTLKQKRILKQKATIMDLQRNCLYCTSYHNGKDPMPPEIIQLRRTEAINWLRGKKVKHGSK